MNMKNKILLAGFFLLPIFSNAQLSGVVYDPTNATNMKTQISTSGKQLAQLQKSVEYMKKASDRLNKVSGYIRDMRDLQDISKMYKESISMVTKIRNNISKIKSNSRKKIILNDVQDALSTINESVGFINKILSNDFFSMSDKDRMELINEERSKIVGKHSKLIFYSDL